MTKLFFRMTVSVDGFVNDRNGDYSKLYEGFEPNEYYDEVTKRTGAIIMGRNSFEAGGDTDTYADTYEYQVPIFVLTHNPPGKRPKENDRLKIIFVADGIESAVRQAKIAAGDKDVAVLGADTGQQLLRAGLIDELQFTVAPIFLGKGVRMFDHLENLEIKLKKLRTFETKQQVEIWYDIVRSSTD